MSNTRKPKNNVAKIDILKPEPVKPTQTKTPVTKIAAAAPVPAKTAPTQTAGVATVPTPAASVSAKPFQPTSVQAAAPKPVSHAAEAPKVGHVLLELVKPGAKHVCVAGSFNEWKPEKTPLVQKGNGRWVGDLAVNPGKHEYLFVVDGQWLPDPNAKESVQNPFGGRNSILTVSA
jgi:hypothetical protein